MFGMQLNKKHFRPDVLNPIDHQFVKDTIIANEMLGPLVANINPSSLFSILNTAGRLEVNMGEVICRQGDIGHTFFVIAEGTFEVYIDGRKVREMQRGDSFGELELLRVTPRAGTVQATSDGLLWFLERGSLKFAYEAPLREKLDLYAEALGRLQLFRQRGEALRLKMADALVEMKFEMGEYIQEQGEAGRSLFVLYEGEVVEQVDGLEVARFVGCPSRKLASYLCSTEESVLVQEVLWSSSMKVVSETALVLALDRSNFVRVELECLNEIAINSSATRVSKSSAENWALLKRCLLSALRQRQAAYVELLGQVEMFQELPVSIRRKLATSVKTINLKKGQVLWREGDPATSVYILYRGALSGSRRGKEVFRLVGDPQMCTAPMWGFRSWQHKLPRQMTLTTVSDTAVVLSLDGQHLSSLEYDLPHWYGSSSPVSPASPSGSGKFNNARDFTSSMDSIGGLIKYSLTELEELGFLGCGSFGIVTLVSHGPTEQKLALKALSKGHIVQCRMQRQVMSEKTTLRLIDSPFVVRLVATFNGEEYLYFLMEAALGGELEKVYETHKSLYGSEPHVSFHIACAARGLQHLHTRSIIYRDLKPANMLLDENGYGKLTDFGLAKVTSGHTSTICGTPEYFAPELAAGHSHTKAVDWWALGVLIYELMMGTTPFYSDDPSKILVKIKIGVKIVKLPPGKLAWVDLFLALCKQDESERLAVRPRGVRNVELHRWYTEQRFDWSAFKERTMPAPWVPCELSSEALHNFRSKKLDELPPFVPAVTTKSSWDAKFADEWGPVILR